MLLRLDYATSHLCPHYKAPLAKGVLASDGRVMCPWHGACFRVQTGDIEDGPSVDGLASFPVIVKGSQVFVDLPEGISFNPVVPKVKPLAKCTRSSNDQVIIVGGGAGGIMTAEHLRTFGYTGKIMIISREAYLPIDRPKLSKGLKVDASKIALRSAQDYEALAIEFLLDTV